jgi:hypothetical protein
MTKLIKTIAAAFAVPSETTKVRFSRGMGPRPAPKTRRG